MSVNSKAGGCFGEGSLQNYKSSKIKSLKGGGRIIYFSYVLLMKVNLTSSKGGMEIEKTNVI
jgi:hypothetical protein